MSITLRYDASAARELLKKKHFKEIEAPLLAARKEVLKDITLLHSGKKIPKEKRPLDSGFINLPQELMDAYEKDAADSLLGRIEQAAGKLGGDIDRLVVLGIGGSYMGLRALFEGVCHPYHNELSRAERNDVPRLYFEGNNVDNDALRGLLQLLESHCCKPDELGQRWGIVVISKSGGTLETAVSFRLFREALERYYGAESEQSRQLVIPVTGEAGRLRDFSNARQYPNVFPIPDDVGGRFSIFTAVGLLPAAVLGIDIKRLLQGAADMTAAFRENDFGKNPVLDYTAVCHLFEKEKGANIRVLSTWGKRLEALGLWYDQLLAESLGKEEVGATPLTVVNTRDLHSRGQQHQEGTLDKLITNVIVETPATEPIAVPKTAGDEDNLNRLFGKTVPDILSAAIEGTNQAYAEASRPTADIRLPQLDEYTLGQLLQMLMLATVVEGRLIGINPYGQPGVEAYKTNMNAVLDRS